MGRAIERLRMMLTIAGTRFHLADSEDASRIVDEALAASLAGAGLVHFETSDNARRTAVVTSHTSVVMTEPRSADEDAPEGTGATEDVAASYLDDLWL